MVSGALWTLGTCSEWQFGGEVHGYGWKAGLLARDVEKCTPYGWEAGLAGRGSGEVRVAWLAGPFDHMEPAQGCIWAFLGHMELCTWHGGEAIVIIWDSGTWHGWEAFLILWDVARWESVQDHVELWHGHGGEAPDRCVDVAWVVARFHAARMCTG